MRLPALHGNHRRDEPTALVAALVGDDGEPSQHPHALSPAAQESEDEKLGKALGKGDEQRHGGRQDRPGEDDLAAANPIEQHPRGYG